MTAVAITIDENAGFSWVDGGTLAAFASMREAGRAICEARRASAEGKKTYLRPLLSDGDLAQHTTFLSFALDERLLEAANRYLGEPALLRSIQLFLTEPNDTVEGSQKGHFDHIGERQLKLFTYLDEVGRESGPFCFAPADASAALASKYAAKGGRYEDEQIEIGGAKVLSLVGPAGAAAMVDTSRCLHFGGRTRMGGRLMLVTQYVRPADDREAANVLRPSHNSGLALSQSQRQALRG